MRTKKTLILNWNAAIISAAILLTVLLAVNIENTRAQSPIHPPIALLDESGKNVLDSGQPASTMETCGACHDTEFIASHSYHSSAGLDEAGDGSTGSGPYPWDSSPGLFGGWNPISYRYLSHPGDELLDLGTAEWISTIGLRHVGGGPALDAVDDGSQVLDPQTGEPTDWDWDASGGVEMNCFLCHLSNPDNEARIEALEEGQFNWANSATLSETGIITRTDSGWGWVAAAFETNGELAPTTLSIQDPDDDNCGLCHGLVQDEDDLPLTTACIPEAWTTQTTGQIISPQRISDSGMNLAGKDELTRSWDVHSERLVDCTDCHYSPNNPVYAEGSGQDTVEHLEFDPRRLELGGYLLQPSHDFATVREVPSANGTAIESSMRTCEDCHETQDSHAWLPYSERHMQAVACETCHIPKMYTTAFKQFDWTAVQTDGNAARECRGVEGSTGTINDLVTGFTPVLMPRMEPDGSTKLAPYNLVASWYWVYGDPARPVRQIDLQAAWLDGEVYDDEVLAVFDADGDGELIASELAIDSIGKEELIAGRLTGLGLDKVRISADVQAYGINHDVAESDWAISDCQVCHSEDSLITAPIELAGYVPGGVLPEFVKDAGLVTDGELIVGEDGGLTYHPTSGDEELYVLGHDNVSWIDWAGVIFFSGTLLGVVAHGGLRTWSARRRPAHHPTLERVYMYTFYERLWHWLQTLAILILLVTGLVIHKPEMFGFMSFRGVVVVHNIVAAILVANAALALFYNLASGDIQRFIPEPRGFFNQAIGQVKYYIGGIFSGDGHPFEKRREDRLNPLQKITYFGILNVLLPAQVLTGILMWGVKVWPEAADALGGLAVLGPLHSLVAWLFATFIVAHVYLTTTAHEPMAGIRSMIMGWDEVEIPSPEENEED